jgi:ribosomal protein S6--L-glutamate ligase
VLAETKKAAESVIGAFRQLDANILVQEFIKEAGGSDIRAFVVGNRVVAAMERTAAPGRVPLQRPPRRRGPRIRLTPEERATAKRAAKILGLNVAGVDLMRSNHGPVVLEVNSSPGLEGIETATGIDVAGKVIEFIENNAGSRRPRGRARRPDRRASGPGRRCDGLHGDGLSLRAAIRTGSHTGENGGA